MTGEHSMHLRIEMTILRANLGIILAMDFFSGRITQQADIFSYIYT